jgi:hypothetical protein
MTTRANGADARAVRLGVAIPRHTGPVDTHVERTGRLCAGLGISLVEVPVETLEAVLNAPVPTTPLEPPPADGLTFGLLELEEEVLRDSYELARQTFDARLRAWRVTASMSPLERHRRVWETVGIAVDVVSAPDLVRWSDDEVDYACRAARAVGARVLATRASLAGPRRLTPFARRHDVVLSFIGDREPGPAGLERLLAHDGEITVAIDIGAWTAGGHGSPVPFILEHLRRISHVRLGATDHAHSSDTLQAMRDHGCPFPAIVGVDASPADDHWHAEVSQALARYRAGLA